MTEFTRKKISFVDGAVSHLEWNADAPLLHFSHANGFNAETYCQLLTPLQGRFRVTAADMRGHGFTTLTAVPGMQAGWDIYRDDLGKLIDALDRRPVFLAGHSMGAIASMRVAAQFPERVRGLILIEPVLMPRFGRLQSRIMRQFGWKPPPGTDLATMSAKRRAIFPSFEAALSAYRGRGAFKTWPDEVIADYLRGGLLPTGNGTEMKLSCDPAWESANFQNAPAGISRVAAQVKCPLTLIYADASNTTRPSEVAIVARGHGKARLVQVPGTTHFLPMERPDIVQDEIARMQTS